MKLSVDSLYITKFRSTLKTIKKCTFISYLGTLEDYQKSKYLVLKEREIYKIFSLISKMYSIVLITIVLISSTVGFDFSQIPPDWKNGLPESFSNSSLCVRHFTEYLKGIQNQEIWAIKSKYLHTFFTSF